MSPAELRILQFALFGVLLFVGIFALARYVRGRIRTKLSAEGVVRASGSRRLTLAFDRFRGQGMMLGMKSIKPGELLLTKEGLYVLCPYAIKLSARDLSNLRVGSADGRLTLETDAPFEATGRVKISFPCEDAPAWTAELAGRGATTA